MPLLLHVNTVLDKKKENLAEEEEVLKKDD